MYRSQRETDNSPIEICSEFVLGHYALRQPSPLCMDRLIIKFLKYRESSEDVQVQERQTILLQKYVVNLFEDTTLYKMLERCRNFDHK